MRFRLGRGHEDGSWSKSGNLLARFVRLTAPTMILLFVMPLSGCHSAAPRSRHREFGAAFDEGVAAYTQYVLPNSMARPEGFDLDAYQRRMLQTFENASAVLNSPEGVTFLDHRLGNEADDLVVICGIDILKRSGQPSAREVIRRYSTSPNSIVAEHASAALAKLARD